MSRLIVRFLVVVMALGSAFVGHASDSRIELRDVEASLSGRGDQVVVEADGHVWVILGARLNADQWSPQATIEASPGRLTISTVAANGAGALTTYRTGGEIDGIAYYDLTGVPDGVTRADIIDGIVSVRAASCEADDECDAGGANSSACSVSGCNGTSGSAGGCSVSCREGAYSCCGCRRMTTGGIIAIVYDLAVCGCCPGAGTT